MRFNWRRMVSMFWRVHYHGMDVVLARGVLGRQAEGVPPHGMKDVETAGPLIARDQVAQGVVADVPHMDSAGRIGKHFQDVVLRLARVLDGLEHLAVLPRLLPFPFRFLEMIAGHRRLPSIRAEPRPAKRAEGAMSVRPAVSDYCSRVSLRSCRAFMRIASSTLVAASFETAASAQTPLASRTCLKTATRTPSARKARPRI